MVQYDWFIKKKSRSTITVNVLPTSKTTVSQHCPVSGLLCLAWHSSMITFKKGPTLIHILSLHLFMVSVIVVCWCAYFHSICYYAFKSLWSRYTLFVYICEGSLFVFFWSCELYLLWLDFNLKTLPLWNWWVNCCHNQPFNSYCWQSSFVLPHCSHPENRQQLYNGQL